MTDDKLTELLDEILATLAPGWRVWGIGEDHILLNKGPDQLGVWHSRE